MITIFSIPKAFSGHFETIQRNAIMSWKLLKPCPEIILLGNDEGTAEAAAEFSLRHVPNVTCNEYGSPLLDDLFEKGQNVASYDTLCYVNADIILTSDFMGAIQRVNRSKPRFLVVGRRWNLDIKEPLDFSPGWEERLTSLVIRSGEKYSERGMDYFVFKRRMWGEIPPFAIGRFYGYWDNWLCYRARSLRIPVIDATDAIMIVHQNHGYSKTVISAMEEGDPTKVPKVNSNIELLGGMEHVFTTEDASHWLPPGGAPRLALGLRYVRRHLETLPMFYPRTAPIAKLGMGLVRITRSARLAFRKYMNSRRSGQHGR